MYFRSKTEKGKYCVISFICGSKKNQIHRNSRMVVAPGVGVGVGDMVKEDELPVIK